MDAEGELSQGLRGNTHVAWADTAPRQLLPTAKLQRPSLGKLELPGTTTYLPFVIQVARRIA